MGEVRIRAFLALPLAPLFQKEITPLAEELKKKYPQVRWVRPAEIHATLHFFGSISSEEVQKISACVSPITRNTPPCSLFLEGIGGFPNARRPRVIWLGIGGEVERLHTMQGSIEKLLSQAGYPFEERSFKAHLTLGRLKEPKPLPGFEALKFPRTETKSVSEIVLFQSHLSPEGAHYEAVETYPLAAA